jgi:hypothetical protein
MNEVSKMIVFILFMLFVTLIISIIVEHYELFIEYRVSKTNNKTYGVQEDFNESSQALELLAKLHTEMDNFVADLYKNYPTDERVIRLVKGIKKMKIEEAPNENGSSYTINKGELMALCLRHKKGEHPFHEYNTLQFVMIHELAHVASISEGHNQEFINNFRFLLRQANALGYYDPVNYSNKPINYCGIKVTNNPYF